MKTQLNKITQAIISTWLFISFAYYLIAKALPNFLNGWVFDNLNSNSSVVLFSISQVINLCLLLTIGVITYFFGEWAYKSWKILIKKDL